MNTELITLAQATYEEINTSRMPLHDPRRQDFLARRAEFTTIGGETNLSEHQRIDGLKSLLNEVREHIKNVTKN